MFVSGEVLAVDHQMDTITLSLPGLARQPVCFPMSMSIPDWMRRPSTEERHTVFQGELSDQWARQISATAEAAWVARGGDDTTPVIVYQLPIHNIQPAATNGMSETEVFRLFANMRPDQVTPEALCPKPRRRQTK